ncbi:MAG: 8-amino-3,8-dideoxy-alpha-D-manno-octulosonate transaminase [Bacteroidia bacterium]|nr:MAG: 8-amino-3,8-dideoxy-alpha-D-manno-octulosonate transaminase [Bacteroidia bacterium]
MPGTEKFGKEELKEVMDVMNTGILFRYNHEVQRNNIWKAREFEEEVKKITGAKYALAVSSGSAGILAALAASGVGYGDEVIVPPFTFAATIEAVLFLGAIPVFAEIDETLCLSAEGIEKAITPKTKAVCLVHMCGGMADMDSILDVVKKHNLLLVEDAGQAFAASYKGTYTGLFGKAGSYSFDFFKIATAGEGGVFVTNDEHTYKMAEYFCDHGHNHEGNNRGMEQHPIVGFNFRISELHAAVGLAQTRRVPEIKTINQKNKRYLQNLIKNEVKEIEFSRLPDESGDSATFLNLMLPNTELAQSFVDLLNQKGTGGFNYWYTNMYHFINQWDHIKNLRFPNKMAIHYLPIPQDYNNLQLPKSQEVIGRLVSFGIRVSWTEEEMNKLAREIINALKQVLVKVK